MKGAASEDTTHDLFESGLSAGSHSSNPPEVRPWQAPIEPLSSHGAAPLSILTDAVCRSLIADMVRQGKAPRTINCFAGTLMAFVRFCREMGWLYGDPMRHVSIPPIVQKPHRYLSMEEIERIRAAAVELDADTNHQSRNEPQNRDDPHADLYVERQRLIPSPVRRQFIHHAPSYTRIVAFLLTGLRASELLSLRAEDIDGGLILVRGKGSRYRWVPLPDIELPAAGPLFDFCYRSLLKYVQDLGKRAGVAHVHPHLFRHTFASWGVQRLDMITVQTVGGWSSDKMLRLYAASTIQQAAARKAAGLFAHKGFGNDPASSGCNDNRPRLKADDQSAVKDASEPLEHTDGLTFA